MMPRSSSLKRSQRFQHLVKVKVGRCRWESESRFPTLSPGVGGWGWKQGVTHIPNAALPLGSGVRISAHWGAWLTQ